jgi:hypothetical protein
VIVAVVAVALAAHQAFTWVGPMDGCDCVLYRQATWNDDGFRRDLMMSRLYAVVSLLLLAGLALALEAHTRRNPRPRDPDEC